MLGAVEHELVAVAPIRGAHRGDVGAGARLGDRERAEGQFLDQASEIGRFLLVVAGDQQRQRRQVVGADRVGDPGASVVQLLDDEAGVEDVEAGAALLARHAEIHQAGLEGLLAHVARKDFLLVVFTRARDHLLLGKFARQRRRSFCSSVSSNPIIFVYAPLICALRQIAFDPDFRRFRLPILREARLERKGAASRKQDGL